MTEKGIREEAKDFNLAVDVIMLAGTLVHKIGVTGGKVQTRIANAALDATFLLADVEVVAEYKLANINRTKFEKILHTLFALLVESLKSFLLVLIEQKKENQANYNEDISILTHKVSPSMIKK